MDDLIRRQAAIDTMCELMRHWFGGDPKDEIREIKRELEKLPSAHPDIIQCNDCRYWQEKGLCAIWDYYISNNEFYCGCAERRIDAETEV